DECSINDERILTYDDFLELSASYEHFRSLTDSLNDYRTDDTATIIYSSGTTGEPKGVVLKHHHFIFAFRIHDQRLEITEQDVSMSFLPLSHVFERLWTHLMLHSGAVCVFLENPREVMDALTTVKPSLMCTVPRFFDKTYQGILDEMARWPSAKRNIFKWAINAGLQANEYRCQSKELPFLLKLKMFFADTLVHKRLRDVFGGNMRIMPCAGAALNTDVLKFFHAMGLFVIYRYGLTETSATVSCFKSDEYTYGTSGTVMPGLELKIEADNEILVKGKSVFSGYYKKEKETREVMENGWFHTGDKGRLDERGDLIMVGRIKDLMKTFVGKYVSPQKLELLIGQEDFVEQVIVVGDNRPYVTALVVPDIVKLNHLAEKSGIKIEEKDLTSSDSIHQLLENRLQKVQEHLSGNERVVKFALLQEPFSMEEGSMTNTLKLRRKIIEKKYRDIIEDLYSGSAKKDT
ncbi:MAG: AMP-dependent synthetase/ligase, partial [Marinilabiliaceae bacterium]